MSRPILLWVLFLVFILSMLILDLVVFHRKDRVVKAREAFLFTGFWISLALIFNVGIYFYWGKELALQFLAGYLVEYSLSVDNLFVFLLVFRAFQVPRIHQHRVLFWGIFGALVMRAIFILLGITLIEKFHWLIYVFGAFLILTGIKMFFEKEKEIHPEKNPLLKIFRRFFKVTEKFEGNQFFVKRDTGLMATPLFLVLLVVESTDVVFATDSIPAILAITRDPFLVFSSNAFAILGLRSLYFALASMMEMFHHLHYGLSLILVFVGVKMVIGEFYKIPIVYTLSFIATTLVISVVASILWPKVEE